MPLLAKLLSFNTLKAPVKKKAKNPYIRYHVDPYSEWEKLGELGDGAFGKVYKVRHKVSGTIAAAKSISIESDEDFEDLTVEVDILSECKHDYLVGLYETYYYDNNICMMIEFCSGGAIDNIIMDLDRSLSESEIKVICRQTLEVLQSLHAKHVIHRDLKAGNILLTEGGIVKLADFGVSAYCKSSQEKRNTHIGTPYWMAPEVISCETDKQSLYNTQADIWSLGITLIELAESQPPYAEMQPTRVLFKIVRAEPPILASNTKWSDSFHDFLRKCLVKDPSGRSTVEQLLKVSI
ncbi:uncharacterized protein TRIADDRAFT_28410 [Trichoplax adhaerens]|uniref:Protein kinase domain-containing protein n=1 Tax=Trichoplax adhaerens TaxID=10228 RepID=B3S316_TRIAD|nr:hypothetical protein TRIADDRAFT_28410 [Trichoplax adhaerens]EDV22887.1 hypothetical protein TRIADDRAFT_28410 [Trichoplax adhaerens]|eukprot:XP_002114753.1 hypothetical protein TRIADDRAFT_28410 [Trichoplax adhaerens]